MSYVTQSQAKEASLELVRNSLDSQVFGDDIKPTLSLGFVKIFPWDPTILTSFQW